MVELKREGTIESKNKGKDGFTAVVRLDDGTKLDAMFAHLYMEKDYKSFEVGERVTMFGKMNGDQLRVFRTEC